jgi:hypothetical protein
MTESFVNCFWYIDDVLSINNSRFAEFLPLIYPPELEVKETTDTASSASFLDLYLEFDDSGQISTKIYEAFEETPTHMSITINRLEEGHNSYPLVCRRPAETVSLQRRQIPELEVKETTDTASSASFLDLYLEFDDSGQISTKIYDKRDDFKIINFPNMCSNIPASSSYGVYISQLIRYARVSSNYSDFECLYTPGPVACFSDEDDVSGNQNNCY